MTVKKSRTPKKPPSRPARASPKKPTPKAKPKAKACPAATLMDKSAKVPRLTKRNIRAIRNEGGGRRRLAHIGGCFLARAGVLVLPPGMSDPNSFDPVDLANIGAALLLLTDCFEATTLYSSADREIHAGFIPGQVTRDGSPYLFKDRFDKAAYEGAGTSSPRAASPLN